MALKNADAETMGEVLEALASGDTSMQDVEMNDKHPLETMHATAQSSKDGARMDEGSQMPEDSQDLHGDSQLDLQLIPEGGKEDEHGKGQPMLESSSDEDEYECEDLSNKGLFVSLFCFLFLFLFLFLCVFLFSSPPRAILVC